MQGIPEYDRHLTDIESATTEAEARNAAKEATRDHRMTAGQKEQLVKAFQFKLAFIMAGPKVVEHHGTGGLTVIEGKGGGTSALTEQSASVPDRAAAPLNIAPMLPLITPEIFRAESDAWTALTTALIDKDKDVVLIGKEKRPHLRVTFWRKVRRAYRVDVQIIGEAEDSERMEARFTLRATAPNGSFNEASAMCSSREGNMANATLDNIAAKAYSRAFNRSLRGLIGFGEPSAEEVEGDA